MKNYHIIKLLFWILPLYLLVFSEFVAGMNPTQDNQLSQLQVATFDVDVTPPIGADLAYDPMIKSWDLKLRAKGIVLLGAEQPIILLSVDWINMSKECFNEFRRTLAATAGTIPERVAVHVVHQHDAPRGNLQNDWVLAALHRLEMAVANSLNNPKSVTHIGLGEAQVYKVASNRRVVKGDTIPLPRFTTCLDSSLRAEPEGVIDPMVSLVSFWNEDEPVAVLNYYATHPQSYYRTGVPNPDYPGIARFFRQLAVPDALQVYFTGAGGNVGAGKYNDGSHENRGILAGRLADGMKRAWESTKLYPISSNSVFWNVEPVAVPIKPGDRERSFGEIPESEKQIDLQCLALGRARILFMPGELFVEYQLEAKKMRPDLFVTMAAYGDGGSGYIPTAAAFPLGGYEVSVTSVTPKVEEILMDGMHKLLNAKR